MRDFEALRKSNEEMVREMEELKLQLQVKDNNIMDVENQMKTDSKKYGAQLAELRTRIMEYEVMTASNALPESGEEERDVEPTKVSTLRRSSSFVPSRKASTVLDAALTFSRRGSSAV